MNLTLTAAELAGELPLPAVLCTLARVTGSHPQVPGTKLWVTADAFRGTVGGGAFERRVLERARALLAEGGGPALEEYALCRQSGQCCGGRAWVLFEPARPRRTAHLFGAGHVGRAVAEVLADMPFERVSVDPRPEWAAGLPAGAKAEVADPVAYARGRAWSEADAACVFTHSHELDYALVEHLLSTPVGYLGLIGSEHKARVFRARLPEALRAAFDERLHCPIGDALPSKHPKVIAVAVAAELLRAWALAGAPEARPA